MQIAALAGLLAGLGIGAVLSALGSHHGALFVDGSAFCGGLAVLLLIFQKPYCLAMLVALAWPYIPVFWEGFDVFHVTPLYLFGCAVIVPMGVFLFIKGNDARKKYSSRETGNLELRPPW